MKTLRNIIVTLLGIGITFGLAIWLILLVTPWIMAFFYKPDKKEYLSSLGTFGDSAGLMNACFSLLAFAAVVITFVIQNRKDNNNEKLARKSQFENVFFNMTSTFEEIVSHLVYKEPVKDIANPLLQSSLYQSNEATKATVPETEKIYQGRQIFRYLYLEKFVTGGNGQVVRGIKGLVETSPGISMNDIREYFFDGTLDHYFRYAYRIVKYVKTSKLIDDDEREGYASIFRAQLSCFELLVLFFNCLGMDENKFKHLVEDYHLFNNIRTEYFPDIEPYSTLYLDKVNSEDGKERNGFDEEAEKKEYSISAFKKPLERNITQRILRFKQIWELKLSFSTRRKPINDGE
jgi:hypothetical protein